MIDELRQFGFSLGRNIVIAVAPCPEKELVGFREEVAKKIEGQEGHSPLELGVLGIGAYIGRMNSRATGQKKNSKP
jgi:hypothetical protein